ncbi:MAG: hypothetical protein GF368_03035 [Candidatus Aenigmarchaeota archaeon]|nr:hypothetical protein [Candidatus Aenigmarchaeota archaeon]
MRKIYVTPKDLGVYPDGTVFDVLGVNCLDTAAILHIQSGGTGRIFWINDIGHAYVIPEGASRSDLAMNNPLDRNGRPEFPNLTVGQVLDLGVDKTGEYVDRWRVGLEKNIRYAWENGIKVTYSPELIP